LAGCVQIAVEELPVLFAKAIEQAQGVEEEQEQQSGPIDAFQLLGRRVAETRELRDMTQQELAKASGLTQTTIARVEKGHKKKMDSRRSDQFASIGILHNA
jgi:DNA-binding XRE family transcriptional regulator